MVRAKAGQFRTTTALVKPASGPPIPKRKPKAKRRPRRPVPDGVQAYTIPQFALTHGLSLDTYYRMARAGDGPEIMKVGKSTRISIEAAKAWRARGMAATQKKRTAREASANA